MSEQKVLLVGASNLRHSVSHFAGDNLIFANITKPGWNTTVENVANLVAELEGKAHEAKAFVFGHLGNSLV